MKPENSEQSTLAEQLNQVFVRPSGRAIDEMRQLHSKLISRPTPTVRYYARSGTPR
jgi:hypothetical protein